jgi:hypothetical protein
MLGKSKNLEALSDRFQDDLLKRIFSVPAELTRMRMM